MQITIVKGVKKVKFTATEKRKVSELLAFFGSIPGEIGFDDERAACFDALADFIATVKAKDA